MSAARTCCVWCPDWPVVALRRRDAALHGVPVAVRERVDGRDVVRSASPEARAQGVRRGMRRREAESCCPGLAVVDADPALEARTFEVVARAVESFTPRVVLDRPGILAFPTRGPARYFGGDAPLAAQVLAAVGDILHDPAAVRAGIADGAFAARLASRRAVPGGSHVVDPDATPAFLAPWPVDVLGDAALAGLLHRLGLPTLGAFAALPAEAVLARFGAGGRHLHDLARGHDDGPPVLAAPPPDLVEQTELDPPAARVDVAAFAAKALADRLLARLDTAGLALTRAVVEAETEHGERLARCWRHAEGFTPATLAERVRWQLDGWLAGAGPTDAVHPDDDARARQDAHALAEAGLDSTTGALTLLRLVPEEVVPVAGRQLGFWGGDQVARDRADRALARLQGMLGHDAVVTFVSQGGRTPAERMRAVPWGDPREPARPPGDGWPGAVPPPSPARVFDPPLPAALLDADGVPVTVSGRGEASAAPAAVRCDALPAGGGPVVGWAGPWAHDVRWWDVRARRRRCLWQVVVDAGGHPVACLVAVERGRAGLEAVYD